MTVWTKMASVSCCNFSSHQSLITHLSSSVLIATPLISSLHPVYPLFCFFPCLLLSSPLFLFILFSISPFVSSLFSFLLYFSHPVFLFLVIYSPLLSFIVSFRVNKSRRSLGRWLTVRRFLLSEDWGLAASLARNWFSLNGCWIFGDQWGWRVLDWQWKSIYGAD